MRLLILLLCLSLPLSPIHPKKPEISWEQKLLHQVMVFLDRQKIKEFENLSARVKAEFATALPGSLVQYSPLIYDRIKTAEKIIALTFDACGGKGRLGNGYDRELIDLLKKEKIPATLFMTAKWILRNQDKMKEILENPLFDIANHGLFHKPASIRGLSIYGIKGTASIEELMLEVELNALYLEKISGKKPRFYRPGTAFFDQTALKIIRKLGYLPLNFSITPGDSFNPKDKIIRIVLKQLKPGAIAIFHMNHPNRFTKEALEELIPKIRAKGYRFVLLKDFLHHFN